MAFSQSRSILTYQSSLDVIDIRLRSEEIEKEKQGERQKEKGLKEPSNWTLVCGHELPKS